MAFEIKISSQHNPTELHQELIKTGRLQIPNFFTEDTAEYLYQILQQNKDWYLAYNEGANYYETPIGEFDALHPAQKQQFMSNIFARAGSQFQYLFKQYYITQAIELDEQPGHPLHQMQTFVNQPDTLDFMRQLTGEPAIKKADSYATCYSPGHLLTDHDDIHDKHDRVAAYTFSMTKVWDKNWGGHLAFFDEVGNVKEAFIPSFNCMNIFLIPQSHAVQQVAHFAKANRLSFLGWLHR